MNDVYIFVLELDSYQTLYSSAHAHSHARTLIQPYNTTAGHARTNTNGWSDVPLWNIRQIL